MTSNEFAEKFLEVFVKNITEHQTRKFRIGKKWNQCLWNLFNHKLLPCFEGDDARNQFDKVDKIGACQIIYPGWFLLKPEWLPLDKTNQTAEGIDNSGLAEFYVIGKDFSWCYVVTHEFDLCGPYFAYAPK